MILQKESFLTVFSHLIHSRLVYYFPSFYSRHMYCIGSTCWLFFFGLYVCASIWIYIRIYIYIYIYIYTLYCMNQYICIYTYKYINIYVYTYTYAILNDVIMVLLFPHIFKCFFNIYTYIFKFKVPKLWIIKY